MSDMCTTSIEPSGSDGRQRFPPIPSNGKSGHINGLVRRFAGETIGQKEVK